MAKEFQPSNQIAKVQNNKQLIELTDKLQPAAPERYAHLHASGEVINGVRTYSLIGVKLLDYSNGTGNNTVTAKCNITPSTVDYLYRHADFQQFTFSEMKTFGDGNMATVTTLSIEKYMYTQDNSQINRAPWCIRVGNGTGERVTTQNGGAYVKKGSYTETKSVSIRLSDLDYFKLLFHASHYIRAWETMIAQQTIPNGVALYRSYIQQLISQRQAQHQQQGYDYNGYPDYMPQAG